MGTLIFARSAKLLDHMFHWHCSFSSGRSHSSSLNVRLPQFHSGVSVLFVVIRYRPSSRGRSRIGQFPLVTVARPCACAVAFLRCCGCCLQRLWLSLPRPHTLHPALTAGCAAVKRSRQKLHWIVDNSRLALWELLRFASARRVQERCAPAAQLFLHVFALHRLIWIQFGRQEVFGGNVSIAHSLFTWERGKRTTLT